MEIIKFKPIDIVDILLVSTVIYYFLSFIRGTKAVQIMLGLLGLLILAFIADFFRLTAFSMITKGLGAAWILIVFILFQPELRNAFARIGQTRFAKFLVTETKEMTDELVDSALALSEKGYGGLIAIERNTPLKNYIETGRRMDAKVSKELIESIFTSRSPLHDGAIIIKGDNIVAAACILPLSDKQLPPTVGTRHRAGIGLSEETDAVCVIVSEETRNISLAFNGNFVQNIPKERLKAELVTKL